MEFSTPAKAPFEMPDLTPPTFRSLTVDIRDHGAIADGLTMNTEAIAASIQACAAAGGGHVIIPKGIWLTGPIHLMSDIDLHLEEGAELRFSTRFEDYLPAVFTRKGLECYSLSALIYAIDCVNIAVTGSGLLDGQGEPWGRKENQTNQAYEKLLRMSRQGSPVEERIFDTPEEYSAPAFIETIRCKNVLLEGFVMKNGPSWMINPVYCENTIIRKVSILSEHKPNKREGFHLHNGGINPNSSRNMIIEDCYICTGDDGIVLKSGMDQDGWRVGIPCENIVIRNCLFEAGARRGFVAIGSEMSGGVRNVYIHDCEFRGTARCVRIKSRRGRGAYVENVWVRNIVAQGIDEGPVILIETLYGSQRPDWPTPDSVEPPVFRNFHFTEIECTSAKRSIEIMGLPECYIEDLYFENVTIKAESGVQCLNARNVHFSNVQIDVQNGPVMNVQKVENLTIQ